MTKLTDEEIEEIVAKLFTPQRGNRGTQAETFRTLAAGDFIPYAETPALRLCQRVQMHKIKRKIAKRRLRVITFRTKGYALDSE